MRDYYSIIYIAYLSDGYSDHEPVLAVSDDKLKVKYYLKEIRKLSKSQYTIRSVTLDKDTAWALYEDYMLQEFSDKYLYLTTRDIVYLSDEIDNEILDWQELLINLKHYQSLVKDAKKLLEQPFTEAIDHMERHLSSVKHIRRLSAVVIARSDILNPNIEKYLRAVGIMEEDRELTEMFYRKVHDND